MNNDTYQEEWSNSYIIETYAYDGDPAIGETVNGSKSGFLETMDRDEAVKQFCYGWVSPETPNITTRLEYAEFYHIALSL